MLGKQPTAKQKREVLALATDQDLLVIEGERSTGCQAAASSSPAQPEGGPDTRRTIGTIEQIAAKHCG